MRIGAIVVAGVVTAAAAVVALGQWRWQQKTIGIRAAMRAASLPTIMTTYDRREIDVLPPPVKRYFEAVLEDGQRIVTAVRFTQDGQFRIDEHKDAWQPFHATQFATMKPPSFDWDARIQMSQGVHIWVRDAYAMGAGSLRASLLGLMTVANIQATVASARGELMRYLAEAVWYPTALLPSQGVRWEGIDHTSARATLTDRVTTVTVEFKFGTDGLVEEVWAASRPRSMTESAPWLCKVSGYEKHVGMHVPLKGEAEWQLPSGPVPYFRGHMTHLDYEFVGG